MTLSLGVHEPQLTLTLTFRGSQSLSATSISQRPTQVMPPLLGCGHTYLRRTSLNRHICSENSIADPLGV